MTRVFSDGAELGGMQFWDWVYDSNIVATGWDGIMNPRSGSYHYKTYTWGSGTLMAKRFFTGLSELYFRCAISTNHTTSAATYGFMYSTTVPIYIQYNTGDGKFYLVINESAVAGTTHTFNQLTYYVHEIYIKIADAPNGRVTLKINGVTEIDYTGDTLVTYSTVDGLCIFTRAYFDDLALNDTAGGSDDSWCGDEHYEVLMPNGDTATIQWTGSDGDKVNNYALVDERPPSGADYVYSNTPTEQDIYDVDDFTATGKIVTRIWSEAIATDANGSGQQIKLGYKHGGTVYLCASSRTLNAAYIRVVGDEALVDPSDSGAWEDADLDAIQFVVERE